MLFQQFLAIVLLSRGSYIEPVKILPSLVKKSVPFIQRLLSFCLADTLLRQWVYLGLAF